MVAAMDVVDPGGRDACACCCAAISFVKISQFN